MSMTDAELDALAEAESKRLNMAMGLSALERRKKELEARHKAKTAKKWGTVDASKGPSKTAAASPSDSTSADYIPTWKRLEMEAAKEAAWEPPAVALKQQQEAAKAAQYKSDTPAKTAYVGNTGTSSTPKSKFMASLDSPQIKSGAAAPSKTPKAASPQSAYPPAKSSGSASDKRVCAGCKKDIAPGSTMVRVSGDIYHQDCFACHNCKKPIEASYSLYKEKVTCDSCLNVLDAKTCNRCKDPIVRGQEYTKLEKRGVSYHVACFKCKTCEKDLGNQFYWEDPGDVYCEDHP